MYSENPAWKRLIDTAPNTNERISLITAIFSNHDQVEMVGNLNGNDAQRFLDVTHEVRSQTLLLLECRTG